MLFDADPGDGLCDDGEGRCALRAAIQEAGSGDGIIVPEGVYTLTLGTELGIDKSLSLSGDGPELAIIQAAESSADAVSRVLFITGDDVIIPNVSISGVTIRHGNANSGGGIFNRGKLPLVNSAVNDNSRSPDGGGVLDDGSLTIVGSVVSRNSANVGGGIRTNHPLTVIDSTIADNVAGFLGGGIHNSVGIVTVSGSTIKRQLRRTDGGRHRQSVWNCDH